MGINRKSGRIQKNLEHAPDLERLAGQLFQIRTKGQKVGFVKIWRH
jgi:hypothetical protein